MAREQANINTGLWADRDWRILPMAQKYLYILLMTHPTINYAGVVDWRLARLAALSPDTTPDSIKESAIGLQAARFIFVDEETEEVLIRSYLRHDGVLKQPKLSVSMANAYAGISSIKIQDIVAFELQRLRSEHEDWAAWKSLKVQEVLKHPGQDMSAFTLNGAQALPIEKASIEAPATPTGDQAQALPTTTATTTATPSSKEEGKKITPTNRKTSCPDIFPVTDSMAAWAKENNISVDIQEQTAKFLDHHASKGSLFVDWTRAWQNWMRNSKDWAKPQADPNAIVPAGYAWANR